MLAIRIAPTIGSHTVALRPAKYTAVMMAIVAERPVRPNYQLLWNPYLHRRGGASLLTRIFAFALAAVLLYLAVRDVNWAEAWSILRAVEPTWVGIALLLYGVSLALRSLRWRLLLAKERWLPPLMVFGAMCAGYLGNLVLPARAGEALRTALIARSGQLSPGFVLSTAVGERVLDVPILVLCAFGAATALGSLPPGIASALWVMAAASIAGLLVLAVAPNLTGIARAVVARLPLRIGLRDALLRQVENLLGGFAMLREPGRLLGFLTLSVFVWLIDAFALSSLATALSLPVPLPLAVLLLAAFGLSSALPSTPGYIGIYQFVGVTVLSPFGFTPDQSIALVVLVQLVGYGEITLLGLIGLSLLNARQPTPSSA